MLDKKIIEHLSKDPVLEDLILNRKLLQRDAAPSVYEALLRAINFQQLAGAAASAIHQRFLNLFPDQYPDPRLILSMSDEELRSAGLSRQKLGYIKNVAEAFTQNNWVDYNWDKHPDDEIITMLTQIKGVGNWTVEMILIFTLKRLDVLPLDDLVVKMAMVELYGVKGLKGKKLNQRLLEIAEPWRPYRSVASRYLWRWKDTIV